MQLAPLKARLAALEDESVDACEAKAALAEKALAKLKERNKRGKAAVELIADAEARLAEAREKLATARAMAPSLQESAAYHANEVRNLKMNIADPEARLRPIKEQLARLDSPDMAAKLANYREQQQEEPRLFNEISELSHRIAALQRMARERSSATITVLDGKSR